MSIQVPATTFAVSPVEHDGLAIPENPARRHLESQVGPIESGQLGGNVLLTGPGNALKFAVHYAFQEHRPLVLSPDIVWLALVQGIARHIQRAPEEMRSQLVAHQGKMLLEVRADHLVKGSWENDWSSVFPNFRSQLQEHMHPQAYRRLRPTFSTTGPVEEIAIEIAVMDAVSSYFEYSVCTLCGIPSITLEGTPEDWTLLRQQLASWAQIGLKTWVTALDPCLQQFERASRGDVHPHFWRNIYRHGDAMRSGEGPRFDGWLSLFFPYLLDPNSQYIPNPWVSGAVDYLTQWPMPDPCLPFSCRGPEHDQIPHSLSRVPFRWQVLNEDFRMEFISGLVGVEQDPTTLALRPRIGWAVRECPAT